MLVNGVAFSSITGDDCSFQYGLTYTTVQVSVTDGTMTISGDYAGTGFSYAGLAGIQIIQTSAQGILPVPVINEWGMIIFMVLAGLGSVYCLRKQRRAKG
jgi:hypothetical protein